MCVNQRNRHFFSTFRCFTHMRQLQKIHPPNPSKALNLRRRWVDGLFAGIANFPSLALRMDYPQGTRDALLDRNNEANGITIVLDIRN